MLVDEVEPVLVDFFTTSVAQAPIRVLVFGEGVPMGANVTSTILLPRAKRLNENESENEKAVAASAPFGTSIRTGYVLSCSRTG